MGDSSAAAVEIRPRRAGDVDALARLALEVHARDGYPPYLRDVRSFLVSPDALGAWVAAVDGAVVGHVAVHRVSSDPVMELATEVTRLPADALGVVARLFVAPADRRLRIGQRLLAHAASEARAHGRRPVLDVWVELPGAVAFYESEGWTRIGTVVVVAPDGARIDEHVYLAPGPA